MIQKTLYTLFWLGTVVISATAGWAIGRRQSDSLGLGEISLVIGGLALFLVAVLIVLWNLWGGHFLLKRVNELTEEIAREEVRKKVEENVENFSQKGNSPFASPPHLQEEQEKEESGHE